MMFDSVRFAHYPEMGITRVWCGAVYYSIHWYVGDESDGSSHMTSKYIELRPIKYTQAF